VLLLDGATVHPSVLYLSGLWFSTANRSTPIVEIRYASNRFSRVTITLMSLFKAELRGG
jgi:hypothetical protein